MIYLAELISVLVPDELEKLKILESNIPNKEAELLSIIIQKNGLVSIEDLLTITQLSESHVYKNISILTQRVIDCLEPNGLIAQLYFLSRKDIAPLFKHELLKNRKNITNLCIEEQLRFYYVGFELLQRGSYINRDEKLIQEFADCLLALGNPEQLKPYIEIRMLRSQFFVYFTLNQRDKMTEVYDFVQKITQNLDPQKHVLAIFHAYQLFFLYQNFTGTQENIEKYLLRALELFPLEKDFLGSEDKVQVLLKVAEAYLVTLRYRQCFAVYQEIMEKFSDKVRYDLYHQSKFLAAAIILEEHITATKILTDSFAHYINSNNESRATMTGLNYAKFYLAIHDYKLAKKFILQAKDKNRKNFFIHYEAELRILDIILAYFTEEPEYVMGLIKKDIKYLQSKGFTLSNSMYTKYLYLIQHWIKKRENSGKSQTWNKTCREILVEFETKFTGVFYYFLKLILQNNVKK